MTSIVIADDHTLLRESIAKLIAAQPDFQLVGQAGTVKETMSLVAQHTPDVLLLDINMPDGDGLELAATLRRKLPGMKIIFLTMHEEDGALRRSIALGADGFVHKSASMGEVVQALQTVAEGGTYLSGSITRRMLDLATGRAKGPAGDLTDRELEILLLIADGARPAEIASSMFISIKTVKNHLTSVYSKLGVETAAQAVAEAYRLGLAVSSQYPSGDGGSTHA